LHGDEDKGWMDARRGEGVDLPLVQAGEKFASEWALDIISRRIENK
jgi:hypothetical protein